MTLGRGAAVGLLAAVCLVGGAVLWGRSVGSGVEIGGASLDELERQAKALYEQQLHDQAADAYLRAAAAAEQAGDGRRARALRAQAAIPLKLAGRVDEARALLLPALDAARAAGDATDEGLALGNLARVEDLAGNPTQALAWRDELVEWSVRNDDPRLEVLTLEQGAVNAARLGDVSGALARIERALKRDDLLEGEERRHDALLAQKAELLAEQGDVEGAWAIWSGMPPTAASLADRALYLSRWGLYAQAIEDAWRAVEAFEAEGPASRVERDEALLLYLSGLIESGGHDECGQQLQRVFSAGGDEAALAPFRVVRARLALAQRRLDDALADLRAVHAAVAGTPEADEVGLLLAAALLAAQADDEAQALLEELPASQAQGLLLGSLLLRRPPGDRLIGEVLGDLRPAARPESDNSLERLRDRYPLGLPSMAVLALEVGLSDADRLRDGPAGAALVAAALHDALDWQAEELAIPDWTPDAAQRQARSERIDAWVAGRLPEGHAVIAVLLGEPGSYLVVCRSGAGGTSFPLPPASALIGQAQALVASLHDTDLSATASAGWRLFRTLFPEGALADLSGIRNWTLIVPDGLSAAPPALLVTSDPDAPDRVSQVGAVSWLVLDHNLTLLPCAPPHGALPEVGVRWLTVGQPQVDSAAMPLSGHAWLDRFGLNVFNAGEPRALAGGETLAGSEANVAELRRRLAGLSGLRLSVPAAGCGRLGGLAFAPSSGSDRGDENAGLLPWQRLAQLPLPPDLIVDCARFHPSDQFYGPAWAAACALVRSRSLLMTRWPVREDLRQAFVARIAAERAQGAPLGAALATVQRDYLLTALQAGDLDAMQPQFWAAWLAYSIE